MGGRTGLDYCAMWQMIDRRIPKKDRETVEEAIRYMECQALDEMSNG